MIENSQITAIVTDAQSLNVTVGQAAALEVGQAINYIKSGEAEISNYVNGTVKPAINAYVTNTAEPMIDSYVNTTVKANIDNYVTNTAESAIDTYVTNTAIPQVESYVDLAKDWAIKTDGTVDGVDYSSKYYAQLILPIATDITTLAGISTDITNVSSMSATITAVAANSTNINAVAGDLSNINTVANDISNIDSVAGNSTNINTVATNISDINTTATNIQSIINAPTYAQLAQDWANKTTGTVDGNEYSAKYYALETASLLSTKQDKLTAGANIQINNNVISAIDTTYTAGTGISISNGVISNTQTSAEWGNITGTLSNQTDLQNALNDKQAVIDANNKLSASYVSGLATVATTGAYSDLSGTPTIPTVNNATLTITQGGTTKGTFTANASSDVTIALDAGGGSDVEAFTANEVQTIWESVV